MIINQEVKVDTEQLYLNFKLLKRRYRSSEDKKELKRLDYFCHPFEMGNDIRLMHDFDLPKPLSLYGLSSDQFMAYDKEKKKKEAITPIAEKFEPFSID